jgi:hypothetical protein
MLWYQCLFKKSNDASALERDLYLMSNAITPTNSVGKVLARDLRTLEVSRGIEPFYV